MVFSSRGVRPYISQYVSSWFIVQTTSILSADPGLSATFFLDLWNTLVWIKMCMFATLTSKLRVNALVSSIPWTGFLDLVMKDTLQVTHMPEGLTKQHYLVMMGLDRKSWPWARTQTFHQPVIVLCSTSVAQYVQRKESKTHFGVSLEKSQTVLPYLLH